MPTRNHPAPDGGAYARATLLQWLLATTTPDLAELRAIAQLRSDLPPGWAPGIVRHLGLPAKRVIDLRRFAAGKRAAPKTGMFAVLFGA